MKQPNRLSLMLLFILCCQTAAFGGRLSKVRKAVRSEPKHHATSSKGNSHPDNSRKDRDDEDDDNDDGVLAGIGKVVRDVSTSHSAPKRPPKKRHQRPRRPRRSPRIDLFASSSTWCEPSWSEPVITETVIYSEPVVTRERVYVEPTPPQVVPTISHPESFINVAPWRNRLEFAYGNNFDDVNSLGLGLLLQKPSSVGFDASLRLFREDYFDERDHLWLGDANVTYELINRPMFQARAGIGVRPSVQRERNVLLGEVLLSPGVVEPRDLEMVFRIRRLQIQRGLEALFRLRVFRELSVADAELYDMLDEILLLALLRGIVHRCEDFLRLPVIAAPHLRGAASAGGHPLEAL